MVGFDVNVVALCCCVVTFALGHYQSDEKRVRRAPLPPGATIPPNDKEPFRQFSHPVGQEWPDIDEETLAKDKCAQTPFEWPTIEVQTTLFVGQPGKITAFIQSWLPLKLVWQRLEQEANNYDLPIYTYSVPLAAESPHHKVISTVAGSEYETELQLFKVTHDDLKLHLYSLIIYVLHPCHEVALTLRNLQMFIKYDNTPGTGIALPRIGHLPKSVNMISAGSEVSLRVFLRDDKPKSPVVKPWFRVYSRRRQLVVLAPGANSPRLKVTDISAWTDGTRRYEINIEMKLSPANYYDTGLYAMLYIPNADDPDYEITVYTEVKIISAFQANNIYTCTYGRVLSKMMKEKEIGVRRGYSNCFYCISYSGNVKPKVNLTVSSNIGQQSLQSVNIIPLGQSYSLAVFTMQGSDWLMNNGGNVTCQTSAGGNNVISTKRVVVYEPVIVERFKLLNPTGGKFELAFQCIAHGNPVPEIEFYITSRSDIEKIANKMTALDQTSTELLRLEVSKHIIIETNRLMINNVQTGTSSELKIRSRSRVLSSLGQLDAVNGHELAYVCLAKNAFSQSYLVMSAP